MRGFDSKAIVVFPNKDTYENRSYSYQSGFKKAVTNLVKYLTEQQIRVDVFYTDDLARILDFPEFNYVMPLPLASRFFIERNCGMPRAREIMIEYPEITNSIASKLVIDVEATKASQFETVLSQNIKAINAIVKSYKISFIFQATNKQPCTVKPKEKDGAIRAYISQGAYMITTNIGGKQYNPNEILNVPYASRSLSRWYD